MDSGCWVKKLWTDCLAELCIKSEGSMRERKIFQAVSTVHEAAVFYFFAPDVLYPFNECSFSLELVSDQSEFNSVMGNLHFLSGQSCGILIHFCN